MGCSRTPNSYIQVQNVSRFSCLLSYYIFKLPLVPNPTKHTILNKIYPLQPFVYNFSNDIGQVSSAMCLQLMCLWWNDLSTHVLAMSCSKQVATEGVVGMAKISSTDIIWYEA